MDNPRRLILIPLPLAMEGTSTKMSASAKANTVFLTDTPEMISEKVRCSAGPFPFLTIRRTSLADSVSSSPLPLFPSFVFSHADPQVCVFWRA